ncbi:t-SNARE [Cantharellus anzutake]|uniref:t-SNARE n=1 Tax=Cantharellus anzutake TaxID=1750568 RepID=UPI001907030D|nr:t-SNARE [Cantharellus anzutake]KAF8338036.1 t-SNARE [Cantharellus anzutake]
MPTTDRTKEFRACVESMRSRSSIPTRDTQSKQRPLSTQKSEFSRMASTIGKDLATTAAKLDKLAQLAKRKTLFDDRPVEISELTFIIKQDIANLNKQISALQSYVKQQKAGNKSGSSKQIDEHNTNVVTLLQSKLASTSINFKEVLEIRTQNMKESKNRTEQFMSNAASAAAQNPPSQSSLLFTTSSSPKKSNKGKGRANDDELLALDLHSAEESIGMNGGQPYGDGGYHQMQLVEQQDDYIQQRSTAITSIESTIAELGQIFTQLATMVAEQRETVQRIDADTIDIANNVGGAQRELLKYYASISSNRWLMMKVFGVLIVFVSDFLLFILVS